jgi:hypothetical protein
MMYLEQSTRFQESAKKVAGGEKQHDKAAVNRARDSALKVIKGQGYQVKK